MVDDASDDIQSIKNILSPLRERFFVDTWFRSHHNGIHANLELGWNVAITRKATTLMNLDPDTIVKPNWIIEILKLHSKNIHSIITGFNTITQGRHRIYDYGPGCVYKETIGGINMCFSPDVFKKIVAPNLYADNWDWLVCHEMQTNRIMFCVTSPSVIQHTGIKEGMHPASPGVIPDIAEDF